MDWKKYVRSQLPALNVPPEREIEIVDELAAQLEATYLRARSSGDSEAAARARAEAEVPDWQALARTLGRIERPTPLSPAPGNPHGGFVTGFVQDVRYARRGLARSPVFTVVTVVTLALGLGIGTVAFSVVDTVLRRPLPFASPERLTLLRASIPPDGRETVELTYLDGQDLAKETSVFEAMSLLIPYAGTTTSLDPPERIEGFELSASTFSMLGVQPILGRSFTSEEGEPGNNRVAILGYGLWQRLGGRPDVIGQTLVLDEIPRTIVGVMPRSFRVEVLPQTGDVYMPLTREHFAAGSRAFRAFRAIARIQPGVAVDQANAVAATVGQRLAASFANTNAGRTFTVHPLQDEIVDGVRPALLLISGLVVLVLLIAGVNVTNLLLARAVSRAREVAVRGALGASRWRLARASMVEAMLLSTIGAGGAVLVAQAIVGGLTNIRGVALPRLDELAIDWRAAITLGLGAIIAAVVVGLIPFLFGERLHSLATLRTGHETSGRHTGRLRAVLVTGQTGLAFVLLAAAVLLTVSLQRLLAVPSGFDSGVSTMRVSAPSVRYTDRASTVRFFTELTDALRAQPIVQSAGFVSILPLTGNAGSTLTVQGREEVPVASRPDVGWHWASPDYFDAMGIRLMRGRAFTHADLDREGHVTVINETLARLHFPNEDPIGRRVYFGGVPPAGINDWHEIIGVVADVRHRSLEGEPDARAYDLFGQHWGRTISLAVKSGEPPSQVAALLRRLVSERDPRLAVFAIRTTDDLVADAVRPRRLMLWLVSAFALAGFAVAVLGVYGVVAYMVAERRREMGVRVALGASAGSIRSLVVSHGLRLVVIGLTLGVVAATLLRRGIESQLYGVTATNIPALTAVALALLLAAAVPCGIVARRATRVDPVSALRSE
jgi:putative ABC transport system permease protein